MIRESLFDSDFPFGYHNPEAEERMRRFARRGYEVHYVEQVGVRNPTHLSGARNIEPIGARPASEVPRLLGSARVCLLPYAPGEFADSLFPVKLIEYLAARRPVVGTPIAALREFDGLAELEEGPERFAEVIVRAAGEDSAEARQRRRDRVASFDWERRIDQLEPLIQGALHGE